MKNPRSIRASNRVAKVQVAKVQVAKVRVAKVRVAKVRVAKVRVAKVQVAKVQVAKVRVAKVQETRWGVRVIRATRQEPRMRMVAIRQQAARVLPVSRHPAKPRIDRTTAPARSSL